MESLYVGTKSIWKTTLKQYRFHNVNCHKKHHFYGSASNSGSILEVGRYFCSSVVREFASWVGTDPTPYSGKTMESLEVCPQSVWKTTLKQYRRCNVHCPKKTDLFL